MRYIKYIIVENGPGRVDRVNRVARIPLRPPFFFYPFRKNMKSNETTINKFTIRIGGTRVTLAWLETRRGLSS